MMKIDVDIGCLNSQAAKLGIYKTWVWNENNYCSSTSLRQSLQKLKQDNFYISKSVQKYLKIYFFCYNILDYQNLNQTDRMPIKKLFETSLVSFLLSKTFILNSTINGYDFAPKCREIFSNLFSVLKPLNISICIYNWK